MTNVTANLLRLIPRSSDFLDRRIGQRGEIFFDRQSSSLRLFDGQTNSGISLARSDLNNVSDAAFIAKATSAGIGSGSFSNFSLSVVGDDSTEMSITADNTLSILGSTGISTSTNPTNGEVLIENTAPKFFRIAVDGEGNIDAETPDDILTVEAGENISLAIDSETKTITISATIDGNNSNSFSTISIPGQNNIAAESSTDTLNIVAGTGINITTDASTDTITITNTVNAGNISFNFLSDSTSASLTIDQIYLPAITMLDVTNSGASAYLFDQYSGNNPTIYALSGTTIAFKLNATGHPFLIQNGAGFNYDTGLIHISTTGVVSIGDSAQGKDSGTLYWKVPSTISGTYRYQCSVHGPMVGSINVKSFATI